MHVGPVLMHQLGHFLPSFSLLASPERADDDLNSSPPLLLSTALFQESVQRPSLPVPGGLGQEQC